jgi:glutathione S-transferase
LLSDAFTKVQYIPLLPQSPLRKLGYKGIFFQVKNLTPGLHVLKLKALTGGLRTVPVLLPQLEAQPEDLADSTQILHSIESRFPSGPLWATDERKAS